MSQSRRPRGALAHALGALPLVLPVVLAACDQGNAQAEDAKRMEQVDESWRMLSRCLVGKPLGSEDKASDRMRMAELALLVEPSAPHAEWPKMCEPLGKQLLEQLGTLAGDAAIDKVEPLKTELRMLEGTSVDVYLSGEDPLIDRLWQAAREVGLEPQREDAPPLREGLEAPRAAEPIAEKDIRELGPSESYIERSELAADSVVRFALGGGDAAALYCRVESRDTPLGHAGCTPLDKSAPSIAFVPLSAQDPAADWYVDVKPERAVHPVGDGKSVVAPFSESAFVFDDGSIADVIEGDNKKPTLIRSLPTGKLERAPLQTPGGARWLGFRGGTIVWRGPIRGTAGRPVLVQDVQKGRIALGGRIELGEVPPDIEHVESCRRGDTLAIALIGAAPKNKDEDAERTVAMVFRKGEEWSRAKWVKARFGAGAHPWAERWWRTMSCSDGAAVLTYLRPDERVGQVRCTPEGCDAKLSEPIAASGKVEKRSVAALSDASGDKVLLLRVIRTTAPMTGITDVVVMRMAPINALANTPDRAVLADEDHLGLKHVGKSLGIVATADAAVGLIHSDKKLYGVRIDAEGKLGPLGTR